MHKNKMSRKPPTHHNESKSEFIEEPEKKVDQIKQEVKLELPWINSNPEIIKSFNIRFALPDKIKVQYIVKNSLDYNSLHEFCKKAILEKIEIELEKLDTNK